MDFLLLSSLPFLSSRPEPACLRQVPRALEFPAVFAGAERSLTAVRQLEGSLFAGLEFASEDINRATSNHVFVIAGAGGVVVTVGEGEAGGGGVAVDGAAEGAAFAGGVGVVSVEGVNLFGAGFNVNFTPRLAFSSTVRCKSKSAMSTLLSPV